MNSILLSAARSARSAPAYRFRHQKLAAAAAAELKTLRSLARTGLKFAGVGPDQSSSFEQAFASLAHTYLRDKAPRLLDFMVGFQLVDRNEDNTQAVGIFGFKAGGQWLYAPVFFLSGDLKGHELLYLKDKDQFVPLKENWVNYLLAKRPYVLGEPESRSLQQLGARSPDLRQLVTPPAYAKYGSVRVDLPASWEGWLVEFAPSLGQLATRAPSELKKFAGFAERFSLDEVLAESLPLCKLAYAVSERYPAIGHYIEKFYGPGLFKQALLQLRDRATAPESVLAGISQKPGSFREKTAVADEKVKITVDDDETITRNVPEMSEEQRERLLRDGYLVEDARTGEEASKAYNTQLEVTLVNPDASGLYDVLVKPGGFERCLVLSNPHSNQGRQAFITVIRLDPRNWVNAYRGGVFAKPNVEPIETFADWYDKQKGTESFKTNSVYVAITRDGQGSCPFRVRRKTGDGRYDASFYDYPEWHTRPLWDPPAGDCCSQPSPRDEAVQLNARAGTRLRAVDGTLFIPSEAKVLLVRQPAFDYDDEVEGVPDEPESKNPPIEPGQLVDVQLQIIQKSAVLDDEPDDEIVEDAYVAKQFQRFPRYYGSRGRRRRRRVKKAEFELAAPADLEARVLRETEPLKVYSNGTEVRLNGDEPRTVKSALFALIREHGLRESVAKALLKEADRHRVCRARIKYAQGYPLLGVGPTAPAIPEPAYGMESYPPVQTIMPQEEELAVPDLAASEYDTSVYDTGPEAMPDAGAMQVAQQAGAAGQKEVFDTAMIAGLLKAVRQDSLVDRYMGDLLKAVDRLGRLLFLFYWHNAEFEDRYGKADMPELEDTLRNAFEVVGDLVLFLKEKDVAPLLSNSVSAPEIESAALI